MVVPAALRRIFRENPGAILSVLSETARSPWCRCHFEAHHHSTEERRHVLFPQEQSKVEQVPTRRPVPADPLPSAAPPPGSSRGSHRPLGGELEQPGWRRLEHGRQLVRRCRSERHPGRDHQYLGQRPYHNQFGKRRPLADGHHGQPGRHGRVAVPHRGLVNQSECFHFRRRAGLRGQPDGWRHLERIRWQPDRRRHGDRGRAADVDRRYDERLGDHSGLRRPGPGPQRRQFLPRIAPSTHASKRGLRHLGQHRRHLSRGPTASSRTSLTRPSPSRAA